MFKVQSRTSLLSKTLKLFASCVAICFILTAPVFYLLTKYYYAEDLIVNAIRHSPSKGEIQLIVGDNQLTISNESIDGKSGKPLNAKTLFQRFRSGDNQQKGNGLGLAIVKAICDFHHWSIEYHFKDGKHQFIVHFPSNSVNI